MNLLDELQKAADRGVAVTIITNGGDAPDLRLKQWKFRTTRDSGYGNFRAAGLELFVHDCDGDSSYWELRDLRKRRRDCIIAKGGMNDHPSHYHFDACLLAAESALFSEVDRRLAILRRFRRRRERARERRR